MSDVVELVKQVLSESRKLYNKLKTLVRVLSETNNDGAFINICLAVKEWEEIDYYLERALEALEEENCE